MMTQVTMMKVTMEITMNHNNDDSSGIGNRNIITITQFTRTRHEDGWPTYDASNARVTGWLCDEVWVEVNMVDRWEQRWVQASGWRWAGVLASGLGTLRTEATCRSASTAPERKERRDLENCHWLWALAKRNLPLQLQKAGENAPCDSQLVKACADWRKKQKIHPCSLKTHMFSQVPPVGFSKGLLPTQSHNSCNNATGSKYSKLQPWWKNDIP